MGTDPMPLHPPVPAPLIRAYHHVLQQFRHYTRSCPLFSYSRTCCRGCAEDEGAVRGVVPAGANDVAWLS